MPYPTQITPDRILDRATQLIETHGAEQMSLHRLAADLGVKTPSLYRYFAGKAELLRAVNLRTVEALIAAVRDAAQTSTAPLVDRIVAMGAAYRRFVHGQPHAYALAFGSGDPASRPEPAALAALAQQIQQIVAPLSGEAQSLAAVRGLWALVHGWMMIELSGQFQRGGDLDAAYESALRTYARGLIEA